MPSVSLCSSWRSEPLFKQREINSLYNMLSFWDTSNLLLHINILLKAHFLWVLWHQIITNLVAWNGRNTSPHSPGGQSKTKCQQSYAPSGNSKGCSLSSFWCPPALLGFWSPNSNLCLFLHIAFSSICGSHLPLSGLCHTIVVTFRHLPENHFSSVF